MGNIKQFFILTFLLVFIGSINAQIDTLSVYNDSLSNLLLQLNREPNRLRRQIDSISKKYGENSKELKSLWSKIHKTDSLNTSILKNIINKFGWPGYSLVGKKGSKAAFLILQHSNENSTIQVEFLPYLYVSAATNDFSWVYVAYLIDRILVYRDDRPQLYGTQVYYDKKEEKWKPFPIIDKKNVDKRRENVGLPPLQRYLKLFND